MHRTQLCIKVTLSYWTLISIILRKCMLFADFLQVFVFTVFFRLEERGEYMSHVKTSTHSRTSRDLQL